MEKSEIGVSVYVCAWVYVCVYTFFLLKEGYLYACKINEGRGIFVFYSLFLLIT